MTRMHRVNFSKSTVFVKAARIRENFLFSYIHNIHKTGLEERFLKLPFFAKPEKLSICPFCLAVYCVYEFECNFYVPHRSQ